MGRRGIPPAAGCPYKFPEGRPLLSSRKGVEKLTITQPETHQSTSLDRFSERLIVITGLGILAITLLVSLDVLMRFFLDEPQLFVDDLTSFLLVAVVFLGTGPTFYKGGHIRVDLMTSRLKPRTQSRLRVVTLSHRHRHPGGHHLRNDGQHPGGLSNRAGFRGHGLPLMDPMVFIPAGFDPHGLFPEVELVGQQGKAKTVMPKEVSTEISH